MTPEEIKSYYTENYSLVGERVVDVHNYEGKGYADVITITPNHIVWLIEFEIVNKTLAWLGSYMMEASRA